MTIKSFLPSSKTHVCPICNHSHPGEGQHGDCRETSDGMWLCHRYIEGDVRQKSHSGDFFYVGSTDKGCGWGKWLPISKLDERRIPRAFAQLHAGRPMHVMDAKDVAAGRFTYDQSRKVEEYNSSSVADMRDLFLRLYGHRIAFDLLKQRITLDEEPMSDGTIQRAYEILDDAFGVVTRKNIAIDALEAAAHKHEFHPLRRYFLNLFSRYREGTLQPADLDGLVRKYLRDEDSVYDDLYSNCLRRWLIALAKRTFEPGCDFSEVLIIAGEQGSRKGDFFRALAGGNRFYTKSVTTDFSGELDRKVLQTMHAHAVVEIPEIGDRMLRHEKKRGPMKGWSDMSYDNFVPMYGKFPGDFNRRFVLCGTENLNSGFLADHTGSRRFPIIPTTYTEANPINIDGLVEERDAIMLAAYLAYKAGEPVYMPSHLVAVREEANSTYVQEATLSEEARDWCLKQEVFTLREFYDAVWRQPPHEFKRHQSDMGRTLATFPWIHKCKITLEDGRRVNAYRVDNVRAGETPQS